MRILAENNVEGMVPYIHAHELPPTLIMEYIEGANLEEVIESRTLHKWPDYVDIALQIARIVRKGHTLTKTVLHRDLKPANIMFRNFWYPDKENEVVILDFDLSWYKGAKGQDPAIDKVDVGYLAPEQLNPNTGTSTKNTLVDSFGMGMTILYMFSGSHPIANQIFSSNWENYVFDQLRRGPAPSWRSAQSRVARLIVGCTREEQSERVDFGQIVDDLELVHTCLMSPGDVPFAEVWAEELMCVGLEGPGYEWNRDQLKAGVSFSSGATIELRGNERTSEVELSARLEDVGMTKRRLIDKRFDAVRSRTAKILSRGGWETTEARATGTREMSVKARIKVDLIVEGQDNVFKSFADFMGEFRFD